MSKELKKDVNYLIIEADTQIPIAVLKKGMNQDNRLRYLIEQHFGMTIKTLSYNSMYKQFEVRLRDDSTLHEYTEIIHYKPINIF